MTVIPTICWSTKLSFEWCFDGEPHNSIVACSDIGCIRDKDCAKLFEKGYFEMQKRLAPSKVLFFTYANAPRQICGNEHFINIYKYGKLREEERKKRNAKLVSGNE